jgi:ribosome maturation factor RimP
MSTIERVRLLVEPIVSAEGLDLYDLELNGGVLRIVVDQPGGVGMDAITQVTRSVSRALDEADPIDGRFTLEVSSPGLERTLRTPEHFRGAIGTTIAVKVLRVAPGERRLRGTLESVDDDGVVVIPDADPAGRRRLGYGEIERARTVFEWGPAPKPGGPKKPRSATSSADTSSPGKPVPGKPIPGKKVIAS